LKTRLLSFIDALRGGGLPVTVSETFDAVQAVEALGVEPAVFREALAATLVKDEADRPLFDAVFDRCFAVPQRQRRKGDRRQPGAAGDGSGGTDGARAVARPQEAPQAPQPQSTRPHQDPHRSEPTRVAADRLAHRRALEATPFHDMSPREVEACDLLVAELAQRLRKRLSRRQHAARRGRLDVRRTLRQSIATGGIPIDPAFRRRRPRLPDLLVLCDHSHSVATASRFLIGLLVPAAEFFRRVRLFAFVDRPVEVSIEHGRLVPHTELDVYARSDFGRVLIEFQERHAVLVTRNTIVLILGDARNNRRPPRADVLAKLHAAARQVVWLNPEMRQRWNTGDSVMSAYQRQCDAVLAAGSLRELQAALQRTFRNL
jgi:uncharacterized protein with von Willebrand factor type A (vWA) domain